MEIAAVGKGHGVAIHFRRRIGIGALADYHIHGVRHVPIGLIDIGVFQKIRQRYPLALAHLIRIHL